MFSNLQKNLDDIELKLMLSKIFSDSPNLMDIIILPKKAERVVIDMRLERIPFSLKSVQVTGDDVIMISLGKLKDKEIGTILSQVLRDAMMNKFNWKDRRESMEHLASLVYGVK